jgi:hypothetical protein
MAGGGLIEHASLAAFGLGRVMTELLLLYNIHLALDTVAWGRIQTCARISWKPAYSFAYLNIDDVLGQSISKTQASCEHLPRVLLTWQWKVPYQCALAQLLLAKPVELALNISCPHSMTPVLLSGMCQSLHGWAALSVICILLLGLVHTYWSVALVWQVSCSMHSMATALTLFCEHSLTTQKVLSRHERAVAKQKLPGTTETCTPVAVASVTVAAS